MRVKVPADIQKRVADKLAEGLVIASRHYNQSFSMPHVSYKLRGMVAGYAKASQWSINLNAQLLIENVDDFIDRTVPHELAHLICDRVYPQSLGITFTRSGRIRRQKRESHGYNWQSVMRVLGCDDITRCHTYDVTNSKVQKKNGKQFQYRCTKPGCGVSFPVGPKRHRRLQQDPRYLAHRGHRGYPLQYLGTATQPKPQPVVQQPKPNNDDWFLKPLHTPAPLPKPGATKQERAYNMYKSDPSRSRADTISLFMAELNMTRAGATTYYYNCQKKG